MRGINIDSSLFEAFILTDCAADFLRGDRSFHLFRVVSYGEGERERMEERENLGEGEESSLPVYSTYTESRGGRNSIRLIDSESCDRCAIRRVKIDRIFKSNYIYIYILKFCLPCSTNLFYYHERFGEAQVQPTDATFSVARGERERGNPTRQPISTILRCLNGCRAIHPSIRQKKKKRKGIIPRTNDSADSFNVSS